MFRNLVRFNLTQHTIKRASVHFPKTASYN